MAEILYLLHASPAVLAGSKNNCNPWTIRLIRTLKATNVLLSEYIECTMVREQDLYQPTYSYLPDILKDGFVKRRFKTPNDTEGNSKSATLEAQSPKNRLSPTHEDKENYGTFDANNADFNSHSRSQEHGNSDLDEIRVQINKEDD